MLRSIVGPVLFLSLLAGGPALADSTFEVVAQGTLDSHSGFEMRISEPGFPYEEYFVYEDAGKLRAYAVRTQGTSTWDVLPGSQYVVATGSMSIGQTWRFIDGDLGEARTARVAASEAVTTAAGIFTAYRVDVSRDATPSVVDDSLWFAAGVGLVKELGYSNGSPEWSDELSSYTVVGGTGYWPLAVGNVWEFVEVSVPAAAASVGEIKSGY